MRGVFTIGLYFGHHFLSRVGLDQITIRSTLAIADFKNEEEVLKQIQKKYEDIVMKQKDKKAFYWTGYRTQLRLSNNGELQDDDRRF